MSLSITAIATDDIPAAVGSGGDRVPGIGTINASELSGREIENWSSLTVKAGTVVYVSEATKDGVSRLVIVNAFC